MVKEYQAYASGGFRVTATNPRLAAIVFFEKFPGKRKCSIIEGVSDGHFFTVSYGRASTGDWPFSVRDIGKKDIPSLPGELP
jgi:hypothetical protein